MIAGTTSIANQDLYPMCVPKLREQVDYLVVRIDLNFNINDKEVIDICRPDKIVYSDSEWNSWNWREETLRQLDNIKPDIVIYSDDDEYFHDNIKTELKEFWNSDKKAIFCNNYKMLTVDNRDVPTYPTSPHMQGFKWSEGLTFQNYAGYAQITQYAWQPEIYWYLKCDYYHLAFWTKEMEIAKTDYVLKRYGKL